MIEVKNLVYRYPKNKGATVKDISFSIDKGEIFGFLGPSGAGKSTTQKILIKLLTNYLGEITILGHNHKKSDSGYFNQIGVCFELPNHYLKLTALENLKYFAEFYRQKPVDFIPLLERVGLAKDADTKVEKFSKGMKMRLNFVRSVMHNPDILFLDEPTSGMDPVNARKIKDIILEQKQLGKTVFITTHNMHDADELCDRIAFIVEGELKIIDSPKNIKQMGGKRVVQVEYENGIIESQEFLMEGLADNLDFLDILRKNHIRSIHSKEASLEDIFIQVTGKNLLSHENIV
ncbi:ABC transporter ATP-binding protein [Maribellus maritimus]|uniref:ABC transporter ATP-binding protein n=1 Tax=Maribellus maritimus TaxID=2870838 RepID=UPI001EEB8721|nr:ABC transporter ATP-binding protein [Maribellus maritimus]MCG6189680.1 ABC transporter ATP-binding protein [Maribellus maritimus]